ncbi:MAG TPA: imidazolonepropionase [Candidatus Krumholzibacteria bacterium]|nr:imidazolonepropionase [Candidatus Krumholzibacteria bacterium]HRX50669.1 imidazolonepropionase [Candidatus Krumholzibacteria bacterium]
MSERTRPAADLIIDRIGQLCTVHAPDLDTAGPRRGAGLERVEAVTDGAVAVGGGRILAAGPRDEVLAHVTTGADTLEIDAAGACVTPAWVDPHTHAVYGRTRQDEYERRNRGETYLEIAAAGGGIHSSVRDLRGRSEDELVELTVKRLGELAALGTGTVEIKSGYGLSFADELKMLRVARAAADRVGLNAVLTCLAAHEVPREYKEDRGEYVRQILEEILPAVAAEGLAQRLDVFCEPTVFDLAETEAILRRGQELGLRACVHADELEPFGGAALAARLGADSADHLIEIDAAGIAALAGSNTVAVLLPATVFTLGLKHYAPARAMIEAGCAVALATDYNPGSSPVPSMPLVQSIACSQMKLSPAEALVGSTLNSAWALGLAAETGSLAPGKRADLLVLDADDYRLVPYHAGRNPVATAVRAGVVAG